MRRSVLAVVCSFAIVVAGVQVHAGRASGASRPYQIRAMPAGVGYAINAVSGDGRIVILGPNHIDRSTGAVTLLDDRHGHVTTLSADGRIGYGVPWDDDQVYRWTLPGGAAVLQAVPLTANDVVLSDVETDAAGRHLLVYGSSMVFAEERLYLYDTAGSTPGFDIAAGLSNGWPQSRQGAMTPDATKVVYAHYDNADGAWSRQQIVVFDAVSRTNTVVSVGVDGAFADSDASLPSISPNGRYVTFRSAATNLVPGASTAVTRLYLLDRLAHTTTVLAALDRSAFGVASVDDDGRVVFVDAGEIEYQGTRRTTTVVDEWTGSAVRRIDLTADGSLPDDGTRFAAPVMSSNGAAIVYHSWASNVTPTPNDQGVLVIERPPAVGGSTGPTTTTTSTTTTSTTSPSTTSTKVPTTTTSTTVPTTTSTTSTPSTTTTTTATGSTTTTMPGLRLDVPVPNRSLAPAVRLG